MQALKQASVIHHHCVFVLVSGLGTSFMTQSTIALVDRPVWHESNDTIAKSSLGYNDSWAGPTKGSLEFDYLKRAGLRASFRTNDHAEPHILRPHCPSAECQWPAYSSLAVCVAMGNVTDRLEFSYNYTSSDVRVKLPHQRESASEGGLPDEDTFYYDHIFDAPIYFPSAHAAIHVSAKDGKPPGTWTDWETPDILQLTLSHLVVLYTNEVQTLVSKEDTYVFHALELIWHLCVKTYNTSVVEGGNLIETSISHTEITDEPPYGLADAKGEKSINVIQRGFDGDMFDVFEGRLRYTLASNRATSGSEDELQSMFSRNMFAPNKKTAHHPEREQIYWNVAEFADYVATSMTAL